MSAPERNFRQRNAVSYEEPSMREFELNAPKRKIGELSQPPPADDGKRSRRQVQGKPSPLDSHAGVEVVVPGAPEFKYSLGGAEVAAGSRQLCRTSRT